MATSADFDAVFSQLKGLLQSCAGQLIVAADEPANYTLNAAPPSKRFPSGLFAAAVQLRKSYVSYHLMPVYAFPDLLTKASPRLRKRMQGKSCFNFTAPLDDELLSELRALTAAGFERFPRQLPGALAKA
jgi:hypothetical protein